MQESVPNGENLNVKNYDRIPQGIWGAGDCGKLSKFKMNKLQKRGTNITHNYHIVGSSYILGTLYLI